MAKDEMQFRNKFWSLFPNPQEKAAVLNCYETPFDEFTSNWISLYVFSDANTEKMKKNQKNVITPDDVPREQKHVVMVFNNVVVSTVSMNFILRKNKTQQNVHIKDC